MGCSVSRPANVGITVVDITVQTVHNHTHKKNPLRLRVTFFSMRLETAEVLVLLDRFPGTPPSASRTPLAGCVHRTARLRCLAFLSQLDVQAGKEILLTRTWLPLRLTEWLILLELRSFSRPVPHSDGMYDLVAQVMSVLDEHPCHSKHVRAADHRLPRGSIFCRVVWRSESVAWPRRWNTILDSLADESITDQTLLLLTDDVVSDDGLQVCTLLRCGDRCPTIVSRTLMHHQQAAYQVR